MRVVAIIAALVLAAQPASADAADYVFRVRSTAPAAAAVEAPIITEWDTIQAIPRASDGSYTLKTGATYRTLRPILDVEADLQALAARTGRTLVSLSIPNRYSIHPTRYGISQVIRAASGSRDAWDISEKYGHLHLTNGRDAKIWTAAEDERETWRLIGLYEVVKNQ